MNKGVVSVNFSGVLWRS